MAVQRTRYTKDVTQGDGLDALPLRIAIDIVNSPYANGTVTTDSASLANVGFEIGEVSVSVSTDNIPDETQVANVSVKIYDDAAGTAWGIMQAGCASNKRLHLVLFVDAGSGYTRYFHGCIDRTSIQREVSTIIGASTQSVISFQAVDLLKQVLQEYKPTDLVGVVSYVTVSDVYVPWFWYWWKWPSTRPLVNTYPDFTDLDFVSYYDLMKSILSFVERATDLTGYDVSVALDHIGVTAREPDVAVLAPTLPVPPPVNTVAYGTGSGGNLLKLHKALAFNKHTFVENTGDDSNREYHLGKCTTLYDAFKLLCKSVAVVPFLQHDETNGLTLSLVSPLSTVINELVFGGPDLLPIRDTLKQYPFAYQIDTASCSVIRPKDCDKMIQDDGTEQSDGDAFNPIYSGQASKNGSGVNGTTLLCSGWVDMHDKSSPSYGRWPYLENLVAVFDDPTTPTKVYTADYSMTNSSFAFRGAYPYQTALFSTNMGWGGGTLGGGSVVTAQAPHWAMALAKGYWSLYCGSVGSDPLLPEFSGFEKIEFEVPMTTVMLGGLLLYPILSKVHVNIGASRTYMVLGAKYNPHESKRTVAITAIRANA